MFDQLIAISGASAGWLGIAAIGVAVVSYFLGCFNGAVVISRFVLRDDVRAHGSGNAGLTNFHRVFGGPLTLLVICADVLKAVLSLSFGMYLASLISLELLTPVKYWAGLFCLLGHMYPVTFGFRGGKGILSGGVMAIMIDWRVALVVWGGFLVLVVLTRYVSLGSCWAGMSFPVASALVFQDTLILILSLIIGALILWKHRGNIKRLLHGTESKLSLRKKDPKAAQSPPPSGASQPAGGEKPSGQKAEATGAKSAPQQGHSGKKGKSKGKSGKGRK